MSEITYNVTDDNEIKIVPRANTNITLARTYTLDYSGYSGDPEALNRALYLSVEAVPGVRAILLSFDDLAALLAHAQELYKEYEEIGFFGHGTD